MTFGESVAVPPIPLAEEILGQALDAVKGELGAAEYASNWEAARGLSLDAAIAEAPAVEGPAFDARQAGPETARQPRPAGLSPREVEVLRPLATGRTSKEVAEDLVLSIRTVERHITHIYEKIGARGRADATAFALKHRLV